MEQGQPENEPHHDPRRQPSYPPLNTAGVSQYLIDQGGRHLRGQ
jgi:hypothetical protein